MRLEPAIPIDREAKKIFFVSAALCAIAEFLAKKLGAVADTSLVPDGTSQAYNFLKILQLLAHKSCFGPICKKFSLGQPEITPDDEKTFSRTPQITDPISVSFLISVATGKTYKLDQLKIWHLCGQAIEPPT